MRVLGDISHAEFKITLFAWNGKYLLKYEQGSLEQTYKVDELDFLEEEVRSLAADESFLEAVTQQFEAMGQALGAGLQRV